MKGMSDFLIQKEAAGFQPAKKEENRSIVKTPFALTYGGMNYDHNK